MMRTPLCCAVNVVVKRRVSCYKTSPRKDKNSFVVEHGVMKITVADVEYVARLARLSLSKAETELFAGQMDAILGYVDKLNELDTADIRPTSHAVPMENAFRDDAVDTSLGVVKALANAPDRADSFYRVPKVIE